jgi:DUF1009 family protein
MVASGAAVLAIEAGRTILVDEAAFVAAADRDGLVVVALDDQGRMD